MMIGSGVDTIMAHSWYGMMNNMQTHLTVTQGDCTPVTMGKNGEMEDGEESFVYLVYRCTLVSQIFCSAVTCSFQTNCFCSTHKDKITNLLTTATR